MNNFNSEKITGKVIAILANEEGEERIFTTNIVTNSGDAYYAAKGAGAAASWDFPAGGIRLGSNSAAVLKADLDVNTFLAGTGKAIEATYPKISDADGDNTGAGLDIVTWKYAYTTAQGNASGILEGAIVDNIVTPTCALCHFKFDSDFDKTSSDTLKVFVNHRMDGI